MKDVAAVAEKLGAAWEQFKQAEDERVQALKDHQESRAAELEAKIQLINKDIDKFSALKRQAEAQDQVNHEHRDRIEELESRLSAPGRTASAKVEAEELQVFDKFMRAGLKNPALEAQYAEIQSRKRQIRGDVTIGTGPAGGFAVPEEIGRDLEKHELLFSPVRRIVKVRQVSTSDYKELLNLRGATSGWVGESGSRPGTGTPLLREITPTHGELYAYPQASEWSLDDPFFNVAQWLAEEVGQEFAVQEGEAVIRGNGTNKPTGMTNTAPVSTEDFASPLRAAAAYQFVTSDSGASPADGAIVADSLFDLVYKLRSPYRARAIFTFNSNTAGVIRKLKDSNGQYHWQPGLQMGQPDRLMGYPIETWEQMDDTGVNKFPVFFGDFGRAYVLVDRVGLRITRDDITNIGFIKFYIRRREGGIVLNNDALKVLKTI